MGNEARGPARQSITPDSDALLCALILAPRTYSRNRFFTLFENPEARRIRRRASRIRGILRQLTGLGKEEAEITGEQVLDDGRVLIRYRVGGLALRRTAALSSLEAATLHYAMSRAGFGTVEDGERRRVEEALAKLSKEARVDA
jgi:hypothetical protein